MYIFPNKNKCVQKLGSSGTIYSYKIARLSDRASEYSKIEIAIYFMQHANKLIQIIAAASQ